MSKKLYLDDPYTFEFEAKIEKAISQADKIGLIFESTYFYPTSGGQIKDKGFIEDSEVTDVFEDGDYIVHIIKKDENDFKYKTGNVLKARIDKISRLNHMALHTAQHILSKVLENYNVKTLSFHMEDIEASIETSLDKISEEFFFFVEDEVNEIIRKNLKVEVLTIQKNEICKFNLRKLPPQDFEEYRMVKINDFDINPCGGTHVKSTGEIGLFKITKIDKVRGNIRLYFKAGSPAFKEFQSVYSIVEKLEEFFTAGKDEILKNLQGMKEEVSLQRKQLKELEKELILNEKDKLTLNSIKINDFGFIYKFYKNRSLEFLKSLSSLITKEDKFLVFLASEDLKNKESVFVLSKSPLIVFDIQKIFKNLKEKYKMTGGGTDFFVQGIVKEFNEKEILILGEELLKFIERK